MSKPKRVALYARTSTADKQDPEMQLRELREFATARGWEIVAVFEDKGYSGKNTARPALKRLLNSAARREIDILAVWKLDRLGRSLVDLINTIQGLAEVGVEFVSLKENLDLTTSQGRLLLNLLGSFAEFEREIIVQRVKAGLEHARASGKRLGRPQVRNDEAIRKLHSEGLSQRKIAVRLGVSKGSVQNALRTTIPKK